MKEHDYASSLMKKKVAARDKRIAALLEAAKHFDGCSGMEEVKSINGVIQGYEVCPLCIKHRDDMAGKG